MLYDILSWFQKVYAFYMQLFLQILLSIAQNVKV